MDNPNTAKVQLYNESYMRAGLVANILNKKFGFELSIENRFERSRRILTYDQIIDFFKSIEDALTSYEEAMRWEPNIKGE